MKIQKAVDFQEYLAKQLKNPKIKKYYNEYGKQLEKNDLDLKKVPGGDELCKGLVHGDSCIIVNVRDKFSKVAKNQKSAPRGG